MISKLLIKISILGFSGVGLLLFTNHPGLAIKIIYYIFLILLGGVLLYEK